MENRKKSPNKYTAANPTYKCVSIVNESKIDDIITCFSFRCLECLSK